MNEALDKLTARLEAWTVRAQAAAAAGRAEPALGQELKDLLGDVLNGLEAAKQQSVAAVQQALARSQASAAKRRQQQAARQAAKEAARLPVPEASAPFGNGKQLLDDDAIRMSIRDLLHEAPKSPKSGEGDEVWEMESLDWQLPKGSAPAPAPAPPAAPAKKPPAKPGSAKSKPPADTKKKAAGDEDVWDIDSGEWTTDRPPGK